MAACPSGGGKVSIKMLTRRDTAMASPFKAEAAPERRAESYLIILLSSHRMTLFGNDRNSARRFQEQAPPWGAG